MAEIRFDSTVDGKLQKSVYEWIKTRKWFFKSPSRKLSDNIFGPTPPNIFVGEYGYPNVFVGPMVSLEEKVVDEPSELYGLNYDALIQNRISFVRGKQQQHVRKPMEHSWEITAAINQVDVEAKFKRPIDFSITFSSHVAPTGPSGEIQKLRVTDNPVIPAKIDEIIEEKMKVREALPELVTDFSYHYIQKILSAGLIGKEKRLVPTKWSITATDKMIADEYLKTVKRNPIVSQPTIYSNTYLFNHFEILLIPGAWEFEQFESFIPNGNIEHEYEPYWGRSDYAETEGGGYYAGRFAVSEGLHGLRKQARAIIFREVSPNYEVPCGVWIVRETVRNAFAHPPTKCSGLNEALEILKTRLKQPVQKYFRDSQILNQRTLADY